MTQTTKNIVISVCVLWLVVYGYLLLTNTHLYVGYDAHKDGGIYWAAAYYGDNVSDLVLYKSDFSLRHLYCKHLDIGRYYGNADEGSCEITWLLGKP